jgi:hypothetical protein
MKTAALALAPKRYESRTTVLDPGGGCDGGLRGDGVVTEYPARLSTASGSPRREHSNGTCKNLSVRWLGGRGGEATETGTRT